MNSKSRQLAYFGGTILTAVTGIAVLLGAINQGTADNLGQVILGILGILGAGAPALATAKVTQQRNDGTLDQPSSPANTAVESIAAVANSFQDLAKTVSNGLQDVQMTANSLGGVLGGLPALGPLAQQIINQNRQPSDKS